MFLVKVNSTFLESEWLQLPVKLYKGHTNKPVMLLDDVRRIFDPTKNSLLINGKCNRWVIYDAHNFCVGRIAAFWHTDNGKMGYFGFFESSNDDKIASALFGAAKKWLKELNCEQMLGPVNFGEKDRFWGLLTEGFTTKGLYLDNFNPPYYVDLFNHFGFIEHDIINTYCSRKSEIPMQRLLPVYNRNIAANRYTYVKYNEGESEHFASDIHSIYMKAFGLNNRLAHISVSDISQLLEMLRPVLDERLFLLAYADGRPAGFILFIKEPEFGSRRTETVRLKGFAFATIAEFRGRGIEAGLIISLLNELEGENVEYEFCLSGINNSTTAMNSLLRKMNAQKIKTHQTYRLKI